MKKKALITVLIILVSFTVLLSACGGGDNDLIAYFADGDFEYSIMKGENGDYAVISVYIGTEFSGTDTTRRVEVPSIVTYNETEYPVKGIGNLAFNAKKVEPIIVNDGVEKIGEFAFAESAATSIELPSSIKEIGDYAFVTCRNIRIISIQAEVPPKLGAYAFKYYVPSGKKYVVNANLKIEVPKDSLELYKAAANWSEYSAILKGV